MAALAAIGCCGRWCDVHCIRLPLGSPRVSAGSLRARRPPASGRYPQPLDPPAPVRVDLPTAYQLTTVLNTFAGPERVVRQQGLPDRGRHPGSGHPCRPRTAKGRCQGQPAADVQHQQTSPPPVPVPPRPPSPRRARISPRTPEYLTFVDQGGWKLSHDSAMTLIQSCAFVALTAAECTDALPQS